jgi:general secretion pathway protein L
VNETLILLLGAAPDAPVRWAFRGDGRILLADTAENVAALAAIAARARGARTAAAIMQGEDAAMRALPAPPKAQAQFRAAASYLLEDELAENLEQIHVATQRHDSGAGLALAARKAVVERWREALREAGVAPDILTADYALLAMAPGRAVIVDAGDRVIGAAGLQGFALERPAADEVVAALLQDESLTEIVIYGPRTVDIEREGVSVDWRGPLGDAALFSLYGEALDAGRAPNLLQGVYRKRRDWRGALGPWRLAAALAAASLALFMLVGVADAVRSLRFADRLEAETLELHRAAFPDAQDADPRTHARQILASGGGSASFLALSNSIADSLGENEGVQIDRIRYNAARDEYSVNLRFTEVSELEALKRALEGRGVATAETGGVRRTGNVYLGELRMSLS